MSKITEPQARVLRTMLRYGSIVIANGPNSPGWYEKPRVPMAPRPAWNTLNYLYWDGRLLSREYDDDGYLVYRLTPKGREKAKELRDVRR